MSSLWLLCDFLYVFCIVFQWDRIFHMFHTVKENKVTSDELEDSKKSYLPWNLELFLNVEKNCVKADRLVIETLSHKLCTLPVSLPYAMSYALSTPGLEQKTFHKHHKRTAVPLCESSCESSAIRLSTSSGTQDMERPLSFCHHAQAIDVPTYYHSPQTLCNKHCTEPVFFGYEQICSGSWFLLLWEMSFQGGNADTWKTTAADRLWCPSFRRLLCRRLVLESVSLLFGVGFVSWEALRWCHFYHLLTRTLVRVLEIRYLPLKSKWAQYITHLFFKVQLFS